MVYLVLKPFYNKYQPSNPEQAFAPGDLVIITEQERAEYLLDQGIIASSKEKADGAKSLEPEKVEPTNPTKEVVTVKSTKQTRKK